MVYFVKIRPDAAGFIHAETEGQTHLTRLIADFRRFSNVSKEKYNNQIAGKSGHDLQSYSSLALTAIGHKLLSQSVCCWTDCSNMPRLFS